MFLKKAKYAPLVLLAYHSLCGIPIIGGETLETIASMDGAERFITGVVIRGPAYSLGASYRFVPECPNDFMLGLNTSLVSLGHLSDAGLASEVRNPDADALGRLSERTFYRSDVRSVSRSRIGIAVMPWDGRAGVSWERRENLDAGILWAVPVKTELFELELLGEAAHLRESDVDAGWYPDTEGTPAGSLGIAALRWRFYSGKYVLGMSSIASAGGTLRPGVLCSLSLGVSGGPWRFRSRSIYTTPYFRSADGERTECRLESAMDWRRRPAHGFRFGIDYRAGSHHRFPVGHQYEDEGSLSFGWKFEFLQLDVTTDWNRIVSPPSLEEDTRKFKKCSFSMRLFSPNGYVEGSVKYDVEDLWKASFGLGCQEIGPFSGSMNTSLRTVDDGLLWDIGMKCRCRFGPNEIIMRVFLADLPDDWNRGQPVDAGDFNVEIRWKTSIGGLT
ncbi:MAG: hypothetical protein P1P77_00660 [Spirochaetaceae bacterium]|nr:hypothetical protein [Spirochaetaceae bacterium]